jgi:hypothetical protein
MGMMVNSYLSPPLFVNQLTEGFESLWKTWAHRRKVNPDGANNPGKQSMTDKPQGKRLMLKLLMAPRGTEAINEHQP